MKTLLFNISTLVFCVLVLVIFPDNVRSQVLDYGEGAVAKYRIAVIPVRPLNYGIYEDNLNYVSNHIANDLRKVNGIETVNIAHSLRLLNKPYLRERFKRIKNTFNDSQFPDPDDLSIIGQALDVDKIILVTGGFDTQKSMLHRGFKSQLNRFNKIIIKPTFDYDLYVAMFDPLTGNLEWQDFYHKSFLLKNFYISAVKMSANPSFLEKFNIFSRKVSTKATESLYKHFYEVESSTVSGEILQHPVEKIKATEGDLTTDGQSISPPQNPVTPPVVTPEEKPVEMPAPAPVIQKEAIPATPPVVTPEKSLETPYTPETIQPEKEPETVSTTETTKEINIEEIKPRYESQLLREYQKRIMERYSQ